MPKCSVPVMPSPTQDHAQDPVPLPSAESPEQVSRASGGGGARLAQELTPTRSSLLAEFDLMGSRAHLGLHPRGGSGGGAAGAETIEEEAEAQPAPARQRVDGANGTVEPMQLSWEDSEEHV